MAYYRIDPFGGFRGDVQSAMVCQILSIINAKKGATPKISDFIPTFVEPENPKPMTPHQIHQALCMKFGRPDKL
jgi:hypothetical protein